MRMVDSDDVVSILEFFKDLEDPRSTVNRRHLLGDLIVICVMAVVAGADGPKAISIWASVNADWLQRHLDLPFGIPSHDTIGRLLATLRPQAFQNCFQRWIVRFSIRSTAGTPTLRFVVAVVPGQLILRRLQTTTVLRERDNVITKVYRFCGPSPMSMTNAPQST